MSEEKPPFSANPLVSVIIPTCNRPEELTEAVESVLMQTYPYTEIIIVDDGSAMNVAEALRSRFPDKVQWIRHEESRGAGAARNTGLLYARGEFVAFLDDDDRWYPEKLDRQVAVFLRNGEALGLVGCGYRYEVEGVLQPPRIPVLPVDPHARFLNGNWLGSTSLPLLRRSSVDLVRGFDPNLPSCQDWDLWLRISRDFAVAMTDAALVVRRVHAGQMTGDIRRKIDGRVHLLEKNVSELMQRPRAHSRHLRRLGILLLLSARPVEARLLFGRALRLQPFDIFCWAGHIFSRFPACIVQPLVRSVSVVRIGKHRLYH